MTPQEIPFSIDHLFQIEDRDGVSRDFVQVGAFLIRTRQHVSHSFAQGGKLVGMAGCIFGPIEGDNLTVAPGEGYLWAMISPEAEKFGVWFHRNVLRCLRAVMRDLKPRRLWAEALVDSERNWRWLLALGLRPLGHRFDPLDPAAPRYARFVIGGNT